MFNELCENLVDNKILKQNIKYYDAEASVYDKNRYESVAGRRVDRFQKQLLANYLMELSGDAKVLELGCGTGRFLPYLINMGYQLTGIDVSRLMLEKARERVLSEVTAPVVLLHNDADTMPFADAYFDAVYSILVINLIQDYQKTFKEVARVVKPGGLFIFSVPNLNSIYFPAGIYINLRKKTATSNKSGYRYSHWFTRTEISKTLKKTGFIMESVQGQPPNVRMKDGARPLTRPIIRWMFAKSVYIKARRSEDHVETA
jgi:ubiquinone/menaquinone biosynthesis C-methylase UbiE